MIDVSSGSENLKCAESYCLPLDYDKLEVPFNKIGAVDISVDLDVLQVSISSTFYEQFFCMNFVFYVNVTRKSCQSVTFVQKICTFNIDEIDYRRQFNQHFTSNFFVQKCFAQLFSS